MVSPAFGTIFITKNKYCGDFLKSCGGGITRSSLVFLRSKDVKAKGNHYF
jgi:hypothetical protein